MVSVNTEDGWLYFGKRIFAIPISPVAVIVRSDIAKDDDDVRFCELIVLGKSNDSFRTAVNIAGVIDYTSSSFLA